MKQASLGLRHELIIDNFAGGGGASTGIEKAIGRAIDIAINHDREAIAMHSANHPRTRHFCEDVFTVDPIKVTAGQPVGLAWFSPDCKHFSKAKGGKPVSKKIRGLAWIVIKYARVVKPRVIMLENVEEFQDWGPLTKDGMPCKERKGLTFRRWRAQLENAGYKVDMKELRACDYGAPTIRKRLFIIARRDGLPIVWPKPTHGPGRVPYRTAAECIDWSKPCPSIFERKKALKPATLRRIANGIRKFVIESANPFVIRVAHGDVDANGKRRGKGEHDIREPLPTQPASNEFAVVSPFITKFRTGATGSPMGEPIPTITAGGDMKRPAGAAHTLGVVVPTLIQTGYGEREGQAPRSLDLCKPLGTVMAQGQKHAVAAVFMGAVSGPTYSQKPRGVEDPISTMTTDTRIGAVAAFLEQANSGMIGHDARKPVSTIVGKGSTQRLVTAQIVGCGGRAGQSRPRDVAEPTQTLTAKADSCLVVAHVQRDMGKSVGHDAAEPLATTTAGGGGHSALIASNLVKLKGTCADGQRIDEPIHTIQAGGTHFAEVRALLLESGLFDDSDQLGVVSINGSEYVIVDIGLRMLQPHELFAAQGFPPDYVIAPTYRGKPISKTAQVRMCGNSVCPPVAEALVRANFAHEQQYEAVA